MSYKKVSKSFDPSLQDMRALCSEHYLFIYLFINSCSPLRTWDLGLGRTATAYLNSKIKRARVTSSLSHNN